MRTADTDQFLDPLTFPIEGILRQAVGSGDFPPEEAWRFLGVMAAQGRAEAEVFLLGLMNFHRHDLAKMAILVEAISRLSSEPAANALAAEFLRVPSNPSTRTYLNVVFRAIRAFPGPLGPSVLRRLAEHANVSYRWRKRFESAAQEAGA